MPTKVSLYGILQKHVQAVHNLLDYIYMYTYFNKGAVYAS